MTNERRVAAGWVLGLASASSMMVALDGTVVATALSRIRLDLGASIEELEWTVNAYSLSFAVLLMTGAALGDRFGRRRLFIGGLGLFTAGSAWCALTSSAGWLITARAVQGVGAALVMPLAMALLSAAFPPERRAKALGLFSGLTGLAVVGGPVLGGAVTQGLAWQWIFWFNVPFGLIVIPLVLAKVPESKGPGGKLDLGGLVLVTGAALALVWGLIRANGIGWSSPEVELSLAATPLLLVAFVLWERRIAAPMVPMKLFASRGFAAGNALALFLYAPLYGALFFVAQYLQVGQGLGPLETGLRMIAWTGAVTFMAPLAGAFVNRIGTRPLIFVGLAGQAVGLGWLGLIARPDTPYWEMIAPMVIAGACVSMAMPATQVAVINAVAPPQIGKASGVFNTLRQLGGVLGVAVTAPVFTAAGSYASPHTFADGFRPAMGLAAGISLTGALIAVLIPARARAAAPAPVQSLPERTAA